MLSGQSQSVPTIDIHPLDGGHGACAPLPTLHLAGMFFGENGARVKPARDDAAEARRLRHSGARRRREL